MEGALGRSTSLGQTLYSAVRGPIDPIIEGIRNLANERSLHRGVEVGIRTLDTLSQIPSYLWLLPGAIIGLIRALGTQLTWDEAINDEWALLTHPSARRAFGLLFWALATPVGAKACTVIQAVGTAGVEAAIR